MEWNGGLLFVGLATNISKRIQAKLNLLYSYIFNTTNTLQHSLLLRESLFRVTIHM